MRLNQIARKLNVSTETIVNYLQKQHINIDNNPNTKLHKEQIAMLTAEFWESKGKEITPTTSLERLSPKISGRSGPDAHGFHSFEHSYLK